MFYQLLRVILMVDGFVFAVYDVLADHRQPNLRQRMMEDAHELVTR